MSSGSQRSVGGVLTIHSNHSDDERISNKADKKYGNEDEQLQNKNKQYSDQPYKNTRITRAPPPPHLANRMQRSENQNKDGIDDDESSKNAGSTSNRSSSERPVSPSLDGSSERPSSRNNNSNSRSGENSRPSSRTGDSGHAPVAAVGRGESSGDEEGPAASSSSRGREMNRAPWGDDFIRGGDTESGHGNNTTHTTNITPAAVNNKQGMYKGLYPRTDTHSSSCPDRTWQQQRQAEDAAYYEQLARENSRGEVEGRSINRERDGNNYSPNSSNSAPKAPLRHASPPPSPGGRRSLSGEPTSDVNADDRISATLSREEQQFLGKHDADPVSETLRREEEEFMKKFTGRGRLDDERGPDGSKDDPNHDSTGSFPDPSSFQGGRNQSGAQSVASFATDFSSIISRPLMTRMHDGSEGPADGRPARYVIPDGQTVTSGMTETVFSHPAHYAGHIPGRRDFYDRAHQPHPPNSNPASPGEPYDRDRGPHPHSRQNSGDSFEDRRGGGGGGARPGMYPPPDDRSIEDSRDGMNSRTRPMLPRVPSQSTISTSGFRSFYSEAYTLRDGSINPDYQHNYGDPPATYQFSSDRSRASYERSNSMENNQRDYYDRPMPPPPPQNHPYYQSQYGPPPHHQQYAGGAPPPGYPPYGGPPPPGHNLYANDYPPHGVPPAYQNYPGPPLPHYHPHPQHHPPPPNRPPPQQQQQQQQPQVGGNPERPLLEVAPGILMRLMGTEETMKAIQRGLITVTSCVVCGMDVHCHSDSEFVLCPDCRVVSPVNQLDNANVSPQNGGFVGLGVKTEMLMKMMEVAGQRF